MPNFFCNLGNILRNVTTNQTNPNTTNNDNNSNREDNPQQQQQQQQQDYDRNPRMPRVHIYPLEEFFAQAQQAAAAAFYPNAPFNEFNPPETQPHPPASTRAIRQLPTVSVTPEDLVDENNRECCICFEEHHIRDKVSRLPCAHIYHPQCIVQWLVKNNTCPQCRYELPTDNVVYERGRKERMKARKPRFAKYELQRMHNKELKELCSRLGLNCVGVIEKKEYIDLIWNSGKVDVINAPDPVEIGSIADLRNMSVGVLKKNMGDAGVFFDPRDVVEKEDMVQIFVNSGRIVFKDGETSDLQHHDGPPEAIMDYGHAPRTNDDISNQNNVMDGETLDVMQDISEADDEHESAQEEEMINNTVDEDNIPKRPRIHLPTQEDETDTNHETTIAHDTISAQPEYQSQSSELPTANRVPHFAERTISQLQELAHELQVDISNCIEKQDIINALTSANSK